MALYRIGWHRITWECGHGVDGMGWRGWHCIASDGIGWHRMTWDSITGINNDYKKHLTPGKTREIPGFIHATFVTAYDYLIIPRSVGF